MISSLSLHVRIALNRSEVYRMRSSGMSPCWHLPPGEYTLSVLICPSVDKTIHFLWVFSSCCTVLSFLLFVLRAILPTCLPSPRVHPVSFPISSSLSALHPVFPLSLCPLPLSVSLLRYADKQFGRHLQTSPIVCPIFFVLSACGAGLCVCVCETDHFKCVCVCLNRWSYYARI